MKILIVDDNKLMRDFIKEVVCRKGDEVFEARDGEEAVAKYFLNRPDCTVMDIKMEKLDGITATRMIKHKFPGSKIVIVTNHSEPQVRKEAEDAGADAFILKDNLLELREIAERLLRRGGDGQELSEDY